MLPGKISKRVVSDRMVWITRMIGEIRASPLDSRSEFLGDSRNIWAQNLACAAPWMKRCKQADLLLIPGEWLNPSCR